jgi:hypothetical protein
MPWERARLHSESVRYVSRKSERVKRTYPAGKHLLVIDVALNPCHEMFNVLGSWHLRGTLVVLAVLPQIFKSAKLFHQLAVT